MLKCAACGASLRGFSGHAWAAVSSTTVVPEELPGDEAIQRYLRLGCEVRCLGRGHVSRIKERLAGDGTK